MRDDPGDVRMAKDRVVDLWSAVFGEPPTLRTDTRLMIEVLVDNLPDPAPISTSRPTEP